jgi:hypothetical protein
MPSSPGLYKGGRLWRCAKAAWLAAPAGLWRVLVAMSESGKTPQQKTPEAARREGAQGRTSKGPADTVQDGEVAASDPDMADEVADVADEVHANA